MTSQTLYDRLQSQTIDWLRFPMAALVVLLHTGALGVWSTQPVYRSLSILTSGGICRLAVPCFFFISGYLFFTKLQEWSWTIWKGKLQKRLRTLLIPYLLWNMIAALTIWLWRAVKDGVATSTFLEHVTEWGSLWDPSLPLDGPLWFVRDLIILCVLAPAIFWLIRRFGAYWLIIVSVAYLIWGQPLEGLLFFSAGSALQIKGKNILDVFRRFRTVALVMSGILLVLILFSYSNSSLYTPVRGLFIIAGIVAAFNQASIAIERGSSNVHPLLSKSSFFIFAAHNILILHEFSHYIVLHLIPFRGELYSCIDLFLRPTIAVAICVGLYWAMGKVTPRTLGLLTGGRIQR